MRRFSCIVGSIFLTMTQAQAELIINGSTSTISSNATVPVTNSNTYYA